MKFFKSKFGGDKGRVSKSRFITKSGSVVKLHRSVGERVRSHKDTLARLKYDRLNNMPKSKIKRFFHRVSFKNLYHYWFSREGAIMALKITGIGAITGFLVLVGLFAYFRKDLPNFRDISGMNLGGSIRYYDKTGQTLLWEDYDAVKRVPVHDNEISQSLKDATVAVEDKDFFKHGGFDVRAIARAGWNNIFGRSGSTQGGSTITQQLVKLTQDWSKDRTVTRKVKELILSVELERSYSKQEILTAYLNTAPYGGIEYGAEVAARDYFDKSAKDLTLDEAAMLATIPKSPLYYSPYSASFDGAAFLGRQHYILDLMYDQGKITKEQRDQAKAVDTLAKVKPRKPKYEGIKAPWFVLTAKEELEKKIFNENTVKHGGWKVTTTLDLNLQKIAEEEVQKGLPQIKRQGGDSAAFVAEDVKTGQVVALVGGSDFSNSDFGQNNYAHDYWLPPGSSFKPYDYTSLIEHSTNAGAGSVLYDSLGPIPGHYPCTTGPIKGGNCLVDYDFRFPGAETLRYALGGSRNVPAVKAMLTAGIDTTIQTAVDLGLESGYKCFADEALTKEAPCYASSAIGDGAYMHLDEHVHGIASISRNGRNIPQTYILKIEDAAGKTLEQWKPDPGKQVVREESAYIVADMLSDPKASYMSHKMHNYKGHKFMIKTGTTNDAKDGLMMGASTQIAAGVWVGYHNRHVAMHGFMETMTQPIWGGFMQRSHDNLKPEERPRPKGIQVLPAYVVRTHVGTSSIEPSPSTDLFPAWYQPKSKNSGEKRTIDIVSNKLATDCTPDRAKKEVTDAAADQFSIDIFVGKNAQSTTSQDKDDVHHCDDIKPHISFVTVPPVCTSGASFVVDVTAGTYPLSDPNRSQFPGTVNLNIDGQIVQSYSVSGPSTLSIPCPSGYTGSHSVSATVIDSVLYDNTTDTRSVNFSSGGGGGGGNLTIDSAKVTGPNTVFSWSNNSGVVTIYKASNNQPLCSGSNGNDTDCQVVMANAPSGTQVYAKDSSHTSSTVKVN